MATISSKAVHLMRGQRGSICIQFRFPPIDGHRICDGGWTSIAYATPDNYIRAQAEIILTLHSFRTESEKMHAIILFVSTVCDY